MKVLRAAILLAITIALFLGLHLPHGLNPPIGAFVNPFGGFWQNNRQLDVTAEDQTISQIRQTVKIFWDNRQVAHVFAENNHDLYFAQGFLTARDRLWQMEFIALAAGGRLAEVVGANAIEHDRFRRRTGMRYAAENALDSMMANSVTREALEAYASGVNAWIDQLTTASLPLEYKLMGWTPEQWTPLKTALVLKYMAWSLTGRTEELVMTRLRKSLGDSLMNVLYLNPSKLSPTIIPPETKWPFQQETMPDAPDSIRHIAPLAINSLFQPQAHNGSNNWAVAPAKTKSGHAILCNDPHLGLHLPSIWYEIQLAGPEGNTYGVAIPGAPSIIIGFNENISWGVTNAATDVLDWYKIDFRDESRREYASADGWQQASVRPEIIKVRDQPEIRDSVLITERGLVVYGENESTFQKGIPVGMALRWTAHDASNELAAFMRLNRASDYADFKDALRYIACPGQNFAYADRMGNIAIHHAGKFPVRWPGQGIYLADSQDPQYDWDGWIPADKTPQVFNPAQGYVASANQRPVDEQYPYYLGGRYASFERAARIDQELQRMDNITPADMMTLQTDVLNLRAQMALPLMLSALDTRLLGLSEARDLDLLRDWNYLNDRNLPAPTLFEEWWTTFHQRIWEDEVTIENTAVKFPKHEVTLSLMFEDTASVFFDDRRTEDKEKFIDMLSLSFAEASYQMTSKYGVYGDTWKWGQARSTSIPHMARLNGFGRYDLPTDGHGTTVNAIKKTHGPSWRMVVEMGDPIKAWGIYPGGQSGNPGSDYYDDMIPAWLAGDYEELIYLKTAADNHRAITGQTTLLAEPARGVY